MKPKRGEQLALFELKPVPKPPKWIEYCTKCGGEIVVERHTSTGFVSEYRSAAGECYACTFSRQS